MEKSVTINTEGAYQGYDEVYTQFWKCECGAQIMEGSKYCSQCGAKISWTIDPDDWDIDC